MPRRGLVNVGGAAEAVMVGVAGRQRRVAGPGAFMARGPAVRRGRAGHRAKLAGARTGPSAALSYRSVR